MILIVDILQDSKYRNHTLKLERAGRIGCHQSKCEASPGEVQAALRLANIWDSTNVHDFELMEFASSAERLMKGDQAKCSPHFAW
jgi:hypothetical protein